MSTHFEMLYTCAKTSTWEVSQFVLLQCFCNALSCLFDVFLSVYICWLIVVLCGGGENGCQNACIVSIARELCVHSVRMRCTGMPRSDIGSSTGCQRESRHMLSMYVACVLCIRASALHMHVRDQHKLSLFIENAFGVVLWDHPELCEGHCWHTTCGEPSHQWHNDTHVPIVPG